MTDNAEKGWFPKSYKNSDDVPLAADEPTAEEVVEESVVVAPVVEEPAPVVVAPKASYDATEADLSKAIAAERAKRAAKAATFDASPEKELELARRNEELQKKLDVLYTIGEWRGSVMYVCNSCAYDSFQLSSIREHVKKHM